jgi:hypothetical protein
LIRMPTGRILWIWQGEIWTFAIGLPRHFCRQFWNSANIHFFATTGHCFSHLRAVDMTRFGPVRCQDSISRSE